MSLKQAREMYTKEPYSPEFTTHLLKQLYHFMESKRVSELHLFSDYEMASLLCAVETIEQLQDELSKIRSVALHWQSQSSYWENQYFNKEY